MNGTGFDITMMLTACVYVRKLSALPIEDLLYLVPLEALKKPS